MMFVIHCTSNLFWHYTFSRHFTSYFCQHCYVNTCQNVNRGLCREQAVNFITSLTRYKAKYPTRGPREWSPFIMGLSQLPILVSDKLGLNTCVNYPNKRSKGGNQAVDKKRYLHSNTKPVGLFLTIS